MHSSGEIYRNAQPNGSLKAKSLPARFHRYTKIRIAEEDKLLKGCPLYYQYVEHVLSVFYM